MRSWSIGLFFYPSIVFFTKPRFWFGSTFCFQDRQKTILRCVSSPCVRKNNFPFEARHFVWNLLTCGKLQNDFGNDPTNVMLFLLLLLWKHSCYFFLRNHRMCWKEICTDSDSRGCVWKWRFAWISCQNGHKLVTRGDNDKDDNSNGFWGFPNQVPNPHKQNGFGTRDTHCLWWPPWCRDILDSTVQISQVWIGPLGSNRFWELWCVTCCFLLCFLWFGFCLHRTRTVHPYWYYWYQ